MADLEAIEVLTQAKERLFECGWRTGSAYDNNYPKMCLEEALIGRRGVFVTQETSLPVKRAAHFAIVASSDSMAQSMGLWYWNDRQTSADTVFSAIDDAILLAKEA